MSSVLIRQERVKDSILTGEWDKDMGFVLREYDNSYGNNIEVSKTRYVNEKDLRKAFSSKLSRMKKMVK